MCATAPTAGRLRRLLCSVQQPSDHRHMHRVARACLPPSSLCCCLLAAAAAAGAVPRPHCAAGTDEHVVPVHGVGDKRGHRLPGARQVTWGTPSTRPASSSNTFSPYPHTGTHHPVASIEFVPAFCDSRSTAPRRLRVCDVTQPPAALHSGPALRSTLPPSPTAAARQCRSSPPPTAPAGRALAPGCAARRAGRPLVCIWRGPYLGDLREAAAQPPQQRRQKARPRRRQCLWCVTS